MAEYLLDFEGVGCKWCYWTVDLLNIFSSVATHVPICYYSKMVMANPKMSIPLHMMILDKINGTPEVTDFHLYI